MPDRIRRILMRRELDFLSLGISAGE